METPKGAGQPIRSMRSHTPRLSERKKKLFDDQQDEDDEVVMRGIQPLGKSRSSNQKTPKSTKTIEALIEGSTTGGKKPPRVISFFETESDEPENDEKEKGELSPTRRSVRLSKKKVSPGSGKSGSDLSTSPHKENIPLKTPSRRQQQEEKQLQEMFNNSMQITPRDKSLIVAETSSEDEGEKSRPIVATAKKSVHKRNSANVAPTGLSPMRKMAKNSISPLDSVSISTKSFYSGAKVSPPSAARSTCRNLFGSTLSISATVPKHRSVKRHDPSRLNRGVGHKIRKCFTKHSASVDIDRILHNVRNDKLRRLITANLEKQKQLEKVHNIIRKDANTGANAKPLGALSARDLANNNNITTSKSDAYRPSIRSSASVCTLDTDLSDFQCDSMDDSEDEDNDLETALRAMDQEVVPLIKFDDTLSTKSDDAASVSSTKRKFFKSGSTSTKKQVSIAGNIRATVKANGKLALVEDKRTKRRNRLMRSSVASEFAEDRATIDAILKNLDNAKNSAQVPLPAVEVPMEPISQNDEPFLDEIDKQLALMNGDEPPPIENGDDIMPMEVKAADYQDFLKRIPYNTDDPEIIERQNLLMDFLISNDICTEENFTIFIADPENHKEEAERIIDELVMVVTRQQQDFRQRIPYNTSDPDLIQQQMTFLDFLEENHLCTEENFDIFIANYEQRKAEADAILSQYMVDVLKASDTESNADVLYMGDDLSTDMNLQPVNAHTDTELAAIDMEAPMLADSADTNCAVPNGNQKLFPIFYPGGCQPLTQPPSRRKQRIWNGGYGSDQYQIDAGQKQFGAHQCKQCGLVYTAHEPEEEKVHRDFHASLHVLRFKGWIDEDIMAIFPEWGQDGRIIRLTEASPQKRRERLMDILKIVDKELGFSSYIVPKTFAAYFAVRKMQIVGLCLVQPLEKASKYINVNGVDCCTEEQFEAKCGISRIWVSPLHRRFHIATKLIQSVQLNTIYGEEIPMDKIAFSAPTEMGKAFAQKICGTENFLVYQ